jgi:hypothetical protein
MASLKTPGACCQAKAPVDVNDGTSARACAPRPGPGREIDAWWVWEYARRVIYVHEALARARVGYTGAAILGQLGEDGYDVLRGILWDLAQAADVVVGTTGRRAAVGGAAGFLVCGAGEAPGAVAATTVGLMIGEGLLAWLGLGVLVAPLREHFQELGAKFEWALLRAWRSQGDPAALDDAARELGGAIGFFVRLVLQALVGHLFAAAGKEGRGADLAWGQLRDSRLFQHHRELEGWLVENLPKLRAQLGKTESEMGR